MEEKSISHGVPWTFVSFGATKVISLLTTVFLARLLSPADFGLMALALLAFGALGLFQDLGLGATLVLRQDFEERALGTILTLLMITAVAVAVIVSALSPLAASFFDEPRLTTLLPVLSTTSVFSSLAWFYESLLQREMDFKRRFAGQVSLSLGFTLTAIPLAIAGAGIWALVLGQVASTVIYSATYLIIVPHRVRPTFERAVAREVFISGRGFLAQGWLAWISENVDYLLVGRLLGSAPLGFYSMAYRLSELTHFGIADPVAKVTFPAFARMRQRDESVTETYLSALRLVGLVACVIGAVLSGAAAPFTEAVFGAKWLPMIGPLAVLGIWAAVIPLQATMGWLLNSTGHAGTLGTLTAVLLVLETPLLIIAAGVSTTAVSFVILGQSLVALPLLALLAHKKLGLRLVSHLGAILPIAFATAAAWLATRATANATESAAPVVSLIASGALGVTAYAAVMGVLDRGTIRLAVGTARRMLGRDIATTAG
ncbi:MAG TPA: oligosaccharide flippase family protein [Solirubrobacterales bacterium]